MTTLATRMVAPCPAGISVPPPLEQAADSQSLFPAVARHRAGSVCRTETRESGIGLRRLLFSMVWSALLVSMSIAAILLGAIFIFA